MSAPKIGDLLTDINSEDGLGVGARVEWEFNGRTWGSTLTGGGWLDDADENRAPGSLDALRDGLGGIANRARLVSLDGTRPPDPRDAQIAALTAALEWFADEGHYTGSYRPTAGFVDACGLWRARAALVGIDPDAGPEDLVEKAWAARARGGAS